MKSLVSVTVQLSPAVGSVQNTCGEQSELSGTITVSVGHPIITGEIVSSTVTSLEQVDVFPFASTTLSVIMFEPRSAQVKSI